MGKELLIKTVAQSIPTYSMSCFLLPYTFCNDLTQLIAKFWWGSNSNAKKMHWMSWEKLTYPKCHLGGGGRDLGFRDLKLFNLSLLVKQCR